MGRTDGGLHHDEPARNSGIQLLPNGCSYAASVTEPSKDDIDPRVAIVTGGSQGIGLATVKAFAARGMIVVAAARDATRLDDASQRSNPHIVTEIGNTADVSNEDDVKSLVRETMERFGRNRRASQQRGREHVRPPAAGQTSSDEWQKLIDTNLTGTYLMCREALPHLEKTPAAYILNIQSTASYASQPGVSLYAASKYGVRALTEALIEEYRDTSVRVSRSARGRSTPPFGITRSSHLRRTAGPRCYGHRTSPTSSCGCSIGPVTCIFPT